MWLEPGHIESGAVWGPEEALGALESAEVPQRGEKQELVRRSENINVCINRGECPALPPKKMKTEKEFQGRCAVSWKAEEVVSRRKWATVKHDKGL